MTLTPELKLPMNLTLRPVDKLALKPILNAYNEDPESAFSALPWLDKNKDIRQQIRDMLFDVETQADSDEIHFPAIATTGHRKGWATDEVIEIISTIGLSIIASCFLNWCFLPVTGLSSRNEVVSVSERTL